MLAVLAVFSGLSTTTALLPSSDCYALNKENYLYDFTDKIGKELELEGELSDFVLRFCVDAQNRSSRGYVNYGRFLPDSMFKHDSSDVDFFQEYKYGDLRLCEHNGNNLMGRETEVRIVCGSCPNEASCKDEFGCICNATYNHNSCKAKVLVAVNCGSRGPRISPGLKIGFQPRGWEVVRNGMTQIGFRKPLHNFSFETHQKSVSLYMTSIVGLASNVGKPQIQVQPPEGLSVEIVSKVTMTKPSETESMTLLEVDWKCEKSREQPYEVNIRVPMDGYDPVEFFLCKECNNYEIQKEAGISTLKMFGALSLIFLLMVALLGLLGITYKFKLQNKGESNVSLISESLDEVYDEEEDRVNLGMQTFKDLHCN